MIDGSDFAFWDYIDEYGIIDEEEGVVIGLRDDAPEEAKKSWEEFEKLEALAIEKGLK